MRRVVSVPVLVLAVLAGGLLPSAPSVALGPPPIVVDNFAFSPASIEIQPGMTAHWEFEQSGHTTTSLQGYWDSGTVADGGVYDRVFPSAGSFGYKCKPHPSMTGVVKVVPLVFQEEAGWRITWATERAPENRNYDVQVRHEDSDTWKWFRKDTHRRAAAFAPKREGVWKIRARTSNTANETSTGWARGFDATIG